MTAPGADRDVQDALAAIDRLVHRYKLLDAQQGLQAARLVTNDPAFEWPAPPPPPPAPAPAQAPPAPEEPAAPSPPPAAPTEPPAPSE